MTQSGRRSASGRLVCYPLTPDRWADFEALFGSRGAYAGCWCMWWRTTRAEFERGQGAGNRVALRQLVEARVVPGILGYLGARAVGWCSVAPREQFGSLNRSPVLKPLDDRPVWSIVCLFVDKAHRREGRMLEMIHGAIGHARHGGAGLLEAYPTLPRSERVPPVSAFMGFPAVYAQAGFVECARPSRARVIMRCRIE